MNLFELQSSFKNYLFDYSYVVDRQDFSIYRKLFWNGIFDLFNNIYPCTIKVLDCNFEFIIKDYIKKFQPESYNYNQVASNFSKYLSTHQTSIVSKFPYIVDLAHFEWLELEVLEMDNKIKLPENCEYKTILNPNYKIVSYCYPILDIAAKIEKNKILKFRKKSTNIVAYRSNDNLVKFIEVSDLACQVLKSATDSILDYKICVHDYVNSNNESDAISFTIDYISIIEELIDLDLVLHNYMPLSLE